MKNANAEPNGRDHEVEGARGEIDSYPDARFPKLLTVEQVAEYLCVSIPYIYKLMNAGLLEYVRIPSAEPKGVRFLRRVSSDYLARFIEAATVNKVA